MANEYMAIIMLYGIKSWGYKTIIMKYLVSNIQLDIVLYIALFLSLEKMPQLIVM